MCLSVSKNTQPELCFLSLVFYSGPYLLSSPPSAEIKSETKTQVWNAGVRGVWKIVSLEPKQTGRMNGNGGI